MQTSSSCDPRDSSSNGRSTQGFGTELRRLPYLTNSHTATTCCWISRSAVRCRSRGLSRRRSPCSSLHLRCKRWKTGCGGGETPILNRLIGASRLQLGSSAPPETRSTTSSSTGESKIQSPRYCVYLLNPHESRFIMMQPPVEDLL